MILSEENLSNKSLNLTNWSDKCYYQAKKDDGDSTYSG